MFILGLDLSTSISAITIIDENEKVVFQKAWDMRNVKKFQSFWEKCEFVVNDLRQIKKEYKDSKVFIEESLFKFQKGKSSIKTIAVLMKFNGIISFVCYELFGKVNYIGPTSARKNAGIKIQKDIDISAKEQTLKWLMENKDFKVEYFTRLGKTGIKKPFYDISDSYVIALAGKKILDKEE